MISESVGEGVVGVDGDGHCAAIDLRLDACRRQQSMDQTTRCRRPAVCDKLGIPLSMVHRAALVVRLQPKRRAVRGKDVGKRRRHLHLGCRDLILLPNVLVANLIPRHHHRIGIKRRALRPISVRGVPSRLPQVGERVDELGDGAELRAMIRGEAHLRLVAEDGACGRAKVLERP